MILGNTAILEIIDIQCVQLVLAPGASAKKAATSVSKALAHGALRPCGVACADPATYEAEVALLQRFLVDTGLASGASTALAGRAARRVTLGQEQETSEPSSAGVWAHAPLVRAVRRGNELVPVQQHALVPSVQTVKAYNALSV